MISIIFQGRGFYQIEIDEESVLGKLLKSDYRGTMRLLGKLEYDLLRFDPKLRLELSRADVKSTEGE